MSEGQAGARVYVAAPSKQVERARRMADVIANAGERVVSRWHTLGGDVDDRTLSVVDAIEALEANVADLDAADVLVALTHEGEGRETYCEIARAIDRRIPIVWSVERGGECLSIHTRAVCVWKVRKDEDVPQGILAVRGGLSSMVQTQLPTAREAAPPPSSGKTRAGRRSAPPAAGSS